MYYTSIFLHQTLTFNNNQVHTEEPVALNLCQPASLSRHNIIFGLRIRSSND